MPSLAELQSLFHDYLANASPAGTDTLAQLVSTQASSDGRRPLSIYKSHVAHAHIHALRKTFPLVAQYLGEENFRSLAKLYFDSHPSTSSDLNVYGDEFPKFLAQNEISSSTEQPALLPDLAKLEWCYALSYFAIEDPPFDFKAFSALPEDAHATLVFNVSSSLQVLTSPFALDEIWSQLKEGKSDHALETSALQEGFLVYRNSGGVEVQRIAPHEVTVLGLIQAGATLMTLAQECEAQAIELDAVIRRLIEQGIIVGFTR